MEMPTSKEQVIVRCRKRPICSVIETRSFVSRSTSDATVIGFADRQRNSRSSTSPRPIVGHSYSSTPRENSPPPIIREAPPHAPHVDPYPQYFTRVVRHNQSSHSGPEQYQSTSYEQQYHGAPAQPSHQQFVAGPPTGQSNAWLTELLSENGTSSAAPPHLLGKTRSIHALNWQFSV